MGTDSDNGSEFLTGRLLRDCQRGQLTFTRCRAYHKDDRAHVEQKDNGQIVEEALQLREELMGRDYSDMIHRLLWRFGSPIVLSIV